MHPPPADVGPSEAITDATAPTADSADEADEVAHEPWRGGPREARIITHHRLAGTLPTAGIDPATRGWEVQAEQTVRTGQDSITLRVLGRRGERLAASLTVSATPVFFGAGVAARLVARLDELRQVLEASERERGRR